MLVALDLAHMPLWKVFSASYTDHLFRYLSLGGLAFLFFYAWRRQRPWAPKIQPLYPAAGEIRREFCHSLLSIGIFALTAVGVVVLKQLGYTRLYYEVGRFGWGYVALSTLLLIVAHDAYFYWTHRLMHWRPFFPLVHRIHHLSHTPTPWAAFAFHPLEAKIQALFFPLIALALPVHPLAALGWLTYMTGMNVLGHCGFETMPRGFAKHWLTRWHNTTTHHDLHHRYVRYNYGLYFNFWDRIMGTNHRAYESEFDRLKQPVAESLPEASRRAELGAAARNINPSRSSTPAG
jgi:lathosterol oxidase